MAHPTELHFITCDFGTPGSWEAGYHTGRDYRARTPTPVFATRAGVVRHAGWGGWGPAYGIQVTRGGRLEFDEAAFKAAYAADPAGTAEMFTTAGDGFAARVSEVAKAASDPDEGMVTAAVKGRQSGIDRMEDSIEEWDRRLQLRRTALERQFTALETALSQMSSQSNWLAGQLSQLPKSS